MALAGPASSGAAVLQPGAVVRSVPPSSVPPSSAAGASPEQPTPSAIKPQPAPAQKVRRAITRPSKSKRPRGSAEPSSYRSGAERDRTVGLLSAIQALSQLSYSPAVWIRYQLDRGVASGKCV